MDDYIHSSLRPKNRHELREVIPKAIEYLLTERRDILEKALKSLPKRLEELRKCNGGVISY